MRSLLHGLGHLPSRFREHGGEVVGGTDTSLEHVAETREGGDATKLEATLHRPCSARIGRGEPSPRNNRSLPRISMDRRAHNGESDIFADPDQAAFPSSFLFRNSTHVIGFWGPPTYQVGANGLSPGNSTLTMNGLDWYGYRQNFEMFIPDSPAWVGSFGLQPTNNPQTALVIQSEFVDPETPMPASAVSESEREARRAQVLERIRIEGARQRR